MGSNKERNHSNIILYSEVKHCNYSSTIVMTAKKSICFEIPLYNPNCLEIKSQRRRQMEPRPRVNPQSSQKPYLAI